VRAGALRKVEGMPQPLVTVSAGDPDRLYDLLRDALTDGPAVLPRAAVTSRAGGPSGDGALIPEVSGVVPDGTAVVVETSGSAAAPKRVVLSRDALLASAAGSDAALGLPAGDRQWLLCLPAHYIAGVQVLVRSIIAGTRPVIDVAAHFDPWRLARAAEELTAPVRLISVVPVQLARLWRAAIADPSLAAVMRRFDRILVGGQALEPSLHKQVLDAGFRVVRTYGASETAGGCVYDGVPFGEVKVRVVDDVVELAGPVLADGYLGDAERSERAFHLEDGVRWYRTGDLGTMREGRLRVLGRADNVIISGGEKVLLDAVERYVNRIPGLDQAVVVGAHDDEWGQVPIIVVAGCSSVMPELAGVRREVAPVLGRAAAPAAILTVDEIPRLASGKPDRRRIAHLAAERVHDAGRRADGHDRPRPSSAAQAEGQAARAASRKASSAGAGR
jgi:O-succinylbenzoic acid--CoA ligase